MKRTCSKCKRELSLSEFHVKNAAKGWLKSRCKACEKVGRHEKYLRRKDRELALNKEWRQANQDWWRNWGREYREKHPERVRLYHARARAKRGPVADRARKRVAYAVSIGKLSAQPCERCGSTKWIHAHHDDYSKPLDVVWLCSWCHRNLHAERDRNA